MCGAQRLKSLSFAFYYNAYYWRREASSVSITSKAQSAFEVIITQRGLLFLYFIVILIKYFDFKRRFKNEAIQSDHKKILYGLHIFIAFTKTKENKYANILSYGWI